MLNTVLLAEPGNFGAFSKRLTLTLADMENFLTFNVALVVELWLQLWRGCRETSKIERAWTSRFLWVCTEYRHTLR